jgi:hypothetical protein
MYTPGDGYPSISDIRTWIGVPATVLADPEMEVVAGAEQTQQGARLDWGGGTLPDDLVAAFFRRVGRHVAAKGIPLGILAADAEYGTVRLSRWDSEIERLEGAYLPIVVVGPYGWTEGA